jgi:hypothetical protein
MTGSQSKKTFQVGSVEVRVRSEPGLQGETVKYLPPGQELEVDPASRTEVDGYIWWKHDQGWSAERDLDGTEVYLLAVEEVEEQVSAPAPSAEAPDEDEQPPAAKLFQIGSVPVRVRSEPSLQGETVKYLDPGQELEVDSTSRTEVDGYVWWKHDQGWSAERDLDGTEVYLLAVEEVEEQVSAPAPSAEAPDEDEQPPAAKLFQIGSVPVRVRSEPSLQGASVKYLDPGQELEVDSTSRTEVDGYIWWKHDQGWSAERTVDGKEIYLFKPGEVVSAPTTPDAPVVSAPATVEGLPDGETLPLRDKLFRRLPVDLAQTQWWQYYGNNVFAYNLWREGKQWYKYAQGLHAGLDFGNSGTRGVQIYAGLEGTFFKHDTSYYRPNALWVKVGDYFVIYGHLTRPSAFAVGQPVGVDTVMGEIEFGGQQHLHLEVRYKERWIVNPLLLMPEEMRSTIFAKFPPSGEYFYRDGSWTQWQTPLDQPVLTLGGPLIGPHAR